MMFVTLRPTVQTFASAGEAGKSAKTPELTLDHHSGRLVPEDHRLLDDEVAYTAFLVVVDIGPAKRDLLRRNDSTLKKERRR